MAIAGGAMSTSIDFGGDLEADLSSATLTAMLGWHPSPRFGFDLGVGSVLTGEIDVGGLETSFDPGILGTITNSYLALYEGDVRPFVLVSLTVSVLTMTGDDNRFTAFDARAGLTVGKTFWERFTPYLAARVFGGPVSWTIAGNDETGGGVHHYSVGAGASFRLPKRIDVFVEGSPLGERSLSLGVGIGI